MRRVEDGQATVFIIGLTAMVALLVVVVINASAVFMERQRLGDLADAVSAAAADELDTDRYYTSGAIEGDLPLRRSTMDSAIRDYLATTGDGDVRWTVSVSETRVTVRLRRHVDLALSPPGWSRATTIGAESHAVLRVHP